MPFRPPTQIEVEQGISYTSSIELDRPASGSISSVSDPPKICWNCSTEPSRSSFSLLSLIRKPDFVFVEEVSCRSVRIRRKSRVPATFDIIDNEPNVGMIQRRSVLRNKYLVAVSEGVEWTIRMPLFTVDFYGVSNQGSNFWIKVWPHKTQWRLLFTHGDDDSRLLAAIAFIHREWWCYS